MSGQGVGLMCGLALALVIAPADAAADPAKDRAALAQFAEAYQPTAKLTGAARTTQACADAAKLDAAGSAFSLDTAPAKAPVDNTAWASAASGLGGSLDNLAKVCKRADRTLTLLGGKTKTADQVVAELDHDVSQVLDRAKPRTLPPAMKTAQAAIAAMLGSPRAICGQHAKLAKALATLAKPPAGAAASWQEVHAQVTASAAAVHDSACGAHRGADEQIGSSLGELHDHFYALVLLVPPC